MYGDWVPRTAVVGAEKAWRLSCIDRQTDTGSRPCFFRRHSIPHAQCIAKHLPHLRPSQVKGLALWVGATILARSGRWNAVLGVLQTLGFGWHATRQYLREWLHDGADRAAPCGVQLDVQACFAPFLRWVLAWWQGSELTLAVSVACRGLAIPVAWRIKTGGRPGPWMPDLCDLPVG